MTLQIQEEEKKEEEKTTVVKHFVLLQSIHYCFITPKDIMSQRTSITSIIALNTKGVATGAAHIHNHLGKMRQKQTNTS